MDITQNFYDKMASQYDKLFQDWSQTTKEQAVILDAIFRKNGFDTSARLLDCACGIGTQSIGLASMGYRVTGSDISSCELEEAKARSEQHHLDICFKQADFRSLDQTFSDDFDIIICMDNALPHMLTEEDLESAVKSISNQLASGGIFAASIRDYDSIVKNKPPYSPPYIHKTENGQRVSFQTWDWTDDQYKLTQYIIDDEGSLSISKFDCQYRIILRDDLSKLLVSCGFSEVRWLFPEDSGFYQPIVVAKK